MDGYYDVCSHFEDDDTQSIVTRRHHNTLKVIDDGHTGEPTPYIYVIMRRRKRRMTRRMTSQIWTQTDYHQCTGMSVIDIAVERSSTKELERRRRRVIRPGKRAMASLGLRVYILGYEISFCRNQTVRSRKRRQFRKLQSNNGPLIFALQ